MIQFFFLMERYQKIMPGCNGQGHAHGMMMYGHGQTKNHHLMGGMHGYGSCAMGGMHKKKALKKQVPAKKDKKKSPRPSASKLLAMKMLPDGYAPVKHSRISHGDGRKHTSFFRADGMPYMKRVPK